ncbi:MAG: pyridoxamine 5'-phosphate oxidase [Porticoccaceae bacterium]
MAATCWEGCEVSTLDNNQLQDNRRDFKFARLRRESLDASPFTQFSQWMDDALQAQLVDPTAMTLATVGEGGRPWQRMVLLKGFDRQGLIFYTNLGSRKAAEIAANPQVSLQFPWLALDRQVIVGGRAEKLSVTEVVKYFLKRPMQSRLAAWASRQSSRINSRQALETQYLQLKEKFADGEVPVPDFWGGFRVVPHEFEFWQGGEHRLHDRFNYRLDEDKQWQINRLAP